MDHPDEVEALFYPLSWSSHKQRRVSYSSFGAEILAAADADDRGFDLKQSFLSLFPHKPLSHELIIDSKALFETITTLHQTSDYRLRKTVSRMRDSFESKQLNVVRWIPGPSNFADALTKRNIIMFKGLNDMLSHGVGNVDLSEGCRLDSDSWK